MSVACSLDFADLTLARLEAFVGASYKHAHLLHLAHQRLDVMAVLLYDRASGPSAGTSDAVARTASSTSTLTGRLVGHHLDHRALAHDLRLCELDALRHLSHCVVQLRSSKVNGRHGCSVLWGHGSHGVKLVSRPWIFCLISLKAPSVTEKLLAVVDARHS